MWRRSLTDTFDAFQIEAGIVTVVRGTIQNGDALVFAVDDLRVLTFTRSGSSAVTVVLDSGFEVSLTVPGSRSRQLFLALREAWTGVQPPPEPLGP
jgi:hypothetical protein